jgi:hypothetical protein
MPALLNAYAALASSEIFAAQRLSEAWLPRRVKPQAEFSADDSPLAENPHANLNVKEAKSTVALHNTLKVKTNELRANLSELARPIAQPSMEQLTKWVAALEPDSVPAQQAAHMLTQGQMVWQADLAPGVPLRMVREDAWRNDANQPAQLEKGAMLHVELNLPNLGRIRVVGSQWGQDISLQISHDASAQGQWTALAPSLLSDLQAQGIDDVRLETLPPQVEAFNG